MKLEIGAKQCVDEPDTRELVELEFECAERMGRGDLLPRGFVHLETTDEAPMLVRRSAITSIEHSGRATRTWVALGDARLSVQGSYEATIARIFGPEIGRHIA